MYALLVSAALLGAMPPAQEPDLWETSPIVVQRREAESQRQIAADNREADSEQTLWICGAIVGGLVLLGLISRSGKK
jgi:hypothetical protein